MRNPEVVDTEAGSTRTLSDDELGGVHGGMKYERNTTNKDVIDARGGQVTILGVTFTLDINGKISSVS